MANNHLNKALDDFAKDVIFEAQRNIGAKYKGRKIDSSGRLRKSLMYTKKKKRSGVMITFGAKDDVQDYASVVEYGRRKDKDAPPPDDLKKWFKQKPIRPKDKDGKFIKRHYTISRGKNKGKRGDRYDSMAYLIGQKIKNDGIKGRRYYSRAIETMMKKHEETIQKAFLDDLELNLVFEK